MVTRVQSKPRSKVKVRVNYFYFFLDSLLNDSTFLGIFDSARPNENMERITMGM